MSGFTFSLQRVLDLREQREREMAARLSTARRAAEEARKAHDSLEDACTDGREHLARVAGEGATRSAGELQYLSVVLEQLSHHALAARDAREAADAELDQTTDAFAVAARARQVLDNLRERHEQEWRQEQAHADQQSMDAIALTRYIAAAMRNGGH